MENLPARIVSKIHVDNAGCWLWTASKDRGGYGHIKWGGKLVRAHRLVYSLLVGDPGPQLDHRCFNRACVNPEHLRSVVNKENAEHRKGANRGSASGVRNVSVHVSTGNWHVRVRHNGVTYSGGVFADIDDADCAARALREKLFTHAD